MAWIDQGNGNINAPFALGHNYPRKELKPLPVLTGVWAEVAKQIDLNLKLRNQKKGIKNDR